MAEAAPIITALQYVFKAGVALDKLALAVEIAEHNGPMLTRLQDFLGIVQTYLKKKHNLQRPELRSHGDRWIGAMHVVSGDLGTIAAEVTKLEKVLKSTRWRDRVRQISRAKEHCGTLETLYAQLQNNYSQLLTLDLYDAVHEGNKGRSQDAKDIADRVDRMQLNVDRLQLNVLSVDSKFDDMFKLYQNLARLMREPVDGLAAVENMVSSADENVSPDAFHTVVETAAASSSRRTVKAPARFVSENEDVEAQYDAQRKKIEELRPRVADFLRKLERGKVAAHLTREDREHVAVLVKELWTPWRLESDMVEYDFRPGNRPIALGVGGYGSVARGTLRVRGSEFKVALKSMHPDISWEGQQTDFLREVSLRYRLRHEAVVYFYGAWWPGVTESNSRGEDHVTNDDDDFDDDHGDDDGEVREDREDVSKDQHDEAPILVMECLGGDVGKLISDGQIVDEVDLLRIFFDLTDGLTYVHGEGVVHNDIKPENLLARAQDGRLVGRAKLTDFGVSVQRQSTVSVRSASHRTATGVVGTPAFMAPEVLCRIAGFAAPSARSGEDAGRLGNVSAQRGGAQSFASDTYSAGVTMCRLMQLHSSKKGKVVSSPSFLMASEYELATMAGEEKLVPEVRGWVCDVFGEDSQLGSGQRIVLSCIQADPKLRPSMKAVREEFGALLRRLVGGLGVCRFEMEMRSLEVEVSDTPALELGNSILTAAEMFALGRKFWRGDGAVKNNVKAAEWFEKSAEGGNLDAMNNLGCMYRSGLGVDQDIGKAESLFGRAVKGGNLRAMDNLAWMYQMRGPLFFVPYDSLCLWEGAAEGGDVAAMSNLGWMYEYGRGVRQDEEKAVKLYTRAAEGGDADAMRRLSDMLKNGRGVARNTQAAQDWRERAESASYGLVE